MSRPTVRNMLLTSAVVALAVPAFAQEADDPAVAPEAMPETAIEQQVEPMPPAEPLEPQQPGEMVEPQPEPAVPAIQLTADEVRQVQEALNQAGHDVGPVDGIWGPRSSAAMAAFQEAQGLPPSGQVTLPTLQALGLSDLAAALLDRAGIAAPDLGEPVPAEPVPAEPMPAEPMPAEPGVGEPPLGEPVPGEPGMGEPGMGETGVDGTGMGQPATAPGLGDPLDGTGQ